jgi:hypothetical protein
MLDVLEEKVNDVHDNVANLNLRLQTTLEKVRSSDKICMVGSCLFFCFFNFFSLRRISFV